MVLAFFALDGQTVRPGGLRVADGSRTASPDSVRGRRRRREQARDRATVTCPSLDDPDRVRPTGAVAQLYGVAVCPMIEVARRGGVVVRLLIGETWERPAKLAAAIRQLVS